MNDAKNFDTLATIVCST